MADGTEALTELLVFQPVDAKTGMQNALVAQAERQVASAMGLVLCLADHELGGLPTPAPSKSGLSAQLSTINNTLKVLDDVPSLGGLTSELHKLVELFRTRLPALGGLTFVDYRNELSHGIEPIHGDDAQYALSNCIGSTARIIRAAFNHLGDIRISNGYTVSVGKIPAAPWIIAKRGGTVLVYKEVVASGVVYFSSNREERTWTVLDSEIVQLVKDRVREISPASESLRYFKTAITQDLKGFGDGNVAPDAALSNECIVVTWARKTSEGSEQRLDTFRVSATNAWQWRDVDGHWVDYAEFLRQIANWPVIVDRLALTLEGSYRSQIRDHRHGTSLSTPNLYGRFVESPPVQIGEISDTLTERVDRSAGARTPRPEILFVTGEAGLGKTYNLIAAARERINSLREPNASQPLFLYINCSGVGLKSLQQLVNDAVVETQNLSFTSVLALCRRGLLVPFIDGFDELVGGAGYRDAFESLRPVLDQIGDGGTLVVSARSSYMASHYQASVMKASAASQRDVNQVTLELSRWSRAEVDGLFHENPQWESYRSKIDDESFSLLGVPFFAQCFHEYVTQRPEVSGEIDVRQILIQNYLERELKKLSTYGGDASTVTVEHLDRIFTEIAGLLFESDDLALDQDAFKLACLAALDLEDTEHRHRAILDRLSVLCGISASQNLDGEVLFSFEHPVFYDMYLARQLDQFLASDPSPELFSARFSQGLLGLTAVESLCTMPSKAIGKYLVPILRTNIENGTVLARNVASIISTLSQQKAPLIALHMMGLELDQLRVGSESKSLNLSDCQVSHLVIDGALKESLRLSNCRVGLLEANTLDANGLSPLSVDSGTTVDDAFLSELGGKTEFGSGAQALDLCGRFGADLSERAESHAVDNDAATFARDVLARMAGRRDRSFTLAERTRRPTKDCDSPWMRRLNEDGWQPLLEALVEAKCATEKRFESSGPSTVSCIFIIPPDELLLEDSTDKRVATFWSLVS